MLKCRKKFNLIVIYILCKILSVYSMELIYQIFKPSLQNNSKIEINELNSIYGTGNKLKDVIYRTSCLSTCNSTNIYLGKLCCSGNDINQLECKPQKYCKLLKNHIEDYLFLTIISTYIAVLVITMIIMFIIFYYLSYKNFLAQEISISGENRNLSDINKKQSLINGLVAATLTLFLFLIIPIIILKIVSFLKKKSMTRLLGGKFQIISSTRLLISLEIKENEKEKRFSNFNEERTWSKRNFRTNSDFNEKNFKIKFPEQNFNNEKNVVVENIDLEIESNQHMEQVIDTTKKLHIFDDHDENFSSARRG
jgi:hypothetical protein